jgi:hypothetical protein
VSGNCSQITFSSCLIVLSSAMLWCNNHLCNPLGIQGLCEDQMDTLEAWNHWTFAWTPLSDQALPIWTGLRPSSGSQLKSCKKVSCLTNGARLLFDLLYICRKVSSYNVQGEIWEDAIQYHIVSAPRPRQRPELTLQLCFPSLSTCRTIGPPH